MAFAHSGIPAILDNASNSVAHFTSFRRDDDGQSYENLETKIEDLPAKVLTMIFLELDSVTRKMIRKVCRKWCQILQGVKILRTHVKLELQHGLSLYEYDDMEMGHYADVKILMNNTVTPELQLLHLIGMDPVCSRPFAVDLIAQILADMKIGNVDLRVTNFEVIADQLDFDMNNTSLNRITIRDSLVVLLTLCGDDNWTELSNFGQKWFEDLVLDMVDYPRQLANIYLHDSGPLERSDSETLMALTGRLDDPCLTILGGMFESVGLTVDPRELLVEVAHGRQIPTFCAKAIIGFLEDPLHTERHPHIEELSTDSDGSSDSDDSWDG